MWNAGTKTLLRRYRAGRAEIDGYAEDYACFVFGLIELAQADPDSRWIRLAVALQRRQDELFWDEERGGWFSTTGKDPTVLLRMKEEYDGAEPAASSVSVLNLLALSHLIEDASWQDKIERTLTLLASRLEQVGRAVPMMAAALSTYVAGPQQITIVRENGAEGVPDLERAVSSRYLPFALTFSVDAARQRDLAEVVPLMAAMKPVAGTSAAYVCRNFACQAPVTSVGELERQLQE
jgi:uncharacterized protein YyaL (SSP411 family)